MFVQFPVDELIVDIADSEDEVNQWNLFRLELEESDAKIKRLCTIKI